MCSLSDHNYGYQTSWEDLGASFFTGISGLPYARRHYELSNVEGSNWMLHRTIAVLQYMPVIGGLAAATERLAYCLFGSNESPWNKAASKPALERMIKNQNKALAEHHQKESYLFNPYVSSMSLSPADLEKKESIGLKFKHHFADAQGPRPTMEDAHFYKEMEKGVLTGVFDGHGGADVSDFASKLFQQKFPNALGKANGNVHEAFEKVIHEIHQKVVNHSEWNHMGSTAVVSYIDNETHQIYTATLGDSEANIYRQTSWFSGITSIPLSCIRDWMSKKDLNRLYNAHGKEPVDDHIKNTGGEAKYLRSQIFNGVNVARALGDLANTGKPGSPLVIHKPKITVNKLKPGDVIVLACDGLKDFLPEKKIVSIVEQVCNIGLLRKIDSLFRNWFDLKRATPPLANQLVDAALKRMGRNNNDNVTVIAIEVS